MSISILGMSYGTLDRARLWARRQSAHRIFDAEEYLKELQRICLAYSLNFSALVAQSAHETANWTSGIWVSDLNPAGIGIVGGGRNLGVQYKSGVEAARAHAYHMMLYTHGYPPNHSLINEWKDLDPRADAVASSGLLGSVNTIEDLTGKWATDPEYHNKIESKLFAIFGSERVPTMTFPIYRELITSGKNFPNQRLSHEKLWITIHETGNRNSGANARMHKTFVVGGGGSYNVSFHFAVDDKEAWQMMRLDQVGWHASDGCNNRETDVGCFGSIAIETCVNSDGNWQKTIENLIQLVSLIISGDNRIDYGTAGNSRFSADRIGTHNKWADNKKWCPTNILNQNLMPYIISEVRRRVGGSPTTEQYAKPSRPAFMANPDELKRSIDRDLGGTTLYACRRMYTATKTTPRLQNTSANSPKIGPDINVGEQFIGEFVYRSNEKWWVMTAFGTRVNMADLSPKVEFVK